MKAALGLLAELMQHAKGERRPLRQLRRETWGLRHISRKDPAYVGRALREHVLYGDNSDFHREYGPTGMRGLSPRSLIDAWQEVQGYAVEIGYVGRQSTTDVAAMVTEHVPLRQRLAPAKQHIVYPRQLPSETTVYFVPHRNAVQTQLWFAIEGSPVRREDMPAADAFSEYLGGSMAGLVFQEIREFRALAYSAYARYQRDESSSQQGHLLGYVGCQADKTFEATDVMLGLLTDMPQKRERLGFVRSALVRSQETETPSFRDLQDKIEQWEWMGLREDPRGWLVPAYERLDFADIARFYSQHVAGRPVAIMVVGDPRKVKPKDLRKYGKVVRLREGALFSR
jgi:predicted Zn-dependent peptidase